MATKNRKELEDAFKEFEAKGGKVTKVKPGRAGGLKPQVTTPNRRGPSGKGGSVISYTFPKTTSDSSEKPAAKKTTKPTPAQQTRENLRKLRSKTVTDKKATNAANAAAAKKKADAKKKTNAKKKTDANKKPPSQKTPSTKLPVPIKVVKKAVETGTLNDLYRAMGQRAGELRKWLRSNKDQIKPKPDRAQTKKPGTDLVPIKKRPQAKSSIPSGGRTTSGAKTPPKVDAKPKTSTKPQPKTTARSLLNKIPKNVQQGLKAAARTTPAVVAAGVLGKQSLDNKGKGSGSSYTVKKGDTLSEIARDKGTTLKALLAANKITASMATGQAKNRAAAVTTAVGLGWLSLQIKSEFTTTAGEAMWDNMAWEDQFARSIDASGILAMYSDLLYTSMNTSMALGGPDISAGLLQPKFPQEKNITDAVTSIGGAGPSIGVELFRGASEFVNGEYGL